MEFSHLRALLKELNFDLANDLGNLLNRTVAMINKYFDGVIPAYSGSTGEFEQSLLEVNKSTVEKYDEAMEKMEFSVALSVLWQLVSRTNKYIDETQPWQLAKEEAQVDQLKAVMVHLAESLRRIAIMLQPFLTQTPKEIFSQLGVEAESLTTWESMNEFGVIPAGIVVKKGNPIFPRLDLEEEVNYIKMKMQGQCTKTRGEKGRKVSTT